MTQGHNSKTVAPDDAGLDNDGPGLADFLPDTSNGYIAKAGAPLENPAGQADPVAVEDALKSVHDPEIPVNIYDLGLIYDCLLYTSPSPRDAHESRMPSSA